MPFPKIELAMSFSANGSLQRWATRHTSRAMAP